MTTSRKSPPDVPAVLDVFLSALRQGTAPSILRRKAVRGDLPLPSREKIEILLRLTLDKSEEISRKAAHTLQNCDIAEVGRALADPSTPAPVFQLLACGAGSRLLESVLGSSSLDPGLRDRIRNRLATETAQRSGSATGQNGGSVSESFSDETTQFEGKQEAEENDRLSVAQKLGRLNPAERVKRALAGTQEERAILIRDSNKLVARTVLQSPKLTDSEIESFASSKTVTEEVLRLIAATRSFTKRYGVIRALVSNPRVPIDVSLPLVGRLNARDLKSLAINRNVPGVLRTAAAKCLPDRQSSSPPSSH